MGVLRRVALIAVLAGMAVTVVACGTDGTHGTDGTVAPTDSFLPTPAVASSQALGDGSGATSYGDGPYGVILIGGAWDAVAAELALHGMRAVVPAEATSSALRAAIADLHGAGVERVAVVAADTGVAAAFDVGARDAAAVDQLITLSATGDASRLGVFPKLFVASEDEAAASVATEMAATAAGDWNAELLVPGDASGLAILDGPGADELLDGILRRLEERR